MGWSSLDYDSSIPALFPMPSTDPHWQFEAWRREFYVVGSLLPPPFGRTD